MTTHEDDDMRNDWVEDTLATLDLNERIGQLVCENGKRMDNKEIPWDEWLDQYPVGSFFVGSEIIDIGADHGDKVRRRIESLQGRTRAPVLFSGDFEHGVGSEVSGLTHLPDLMGLGATFDPDLAWEYGRIIAEEALSLGVRWTFAPVVDLNVNPQNPVTNVRAMTDDVDFALEMLKPHVAGIQESGIAACAKHFPGDGTDSRNQHLVTSLNLLSLDEWRQTHGRVFKELIEAGVQSIMVGHLGFPAYEEPEGETGLHIPATASRKLMTNLLRDELGFEGVIVTDALSMCGYRSWGDYEKRILATLNGGADVFLWPEAESFFPLVRRALEDGRVTMETIDQAARRVLQFKADLGLHQTNAAPPKKCGAETLESHCEFAVSVAEKGVTLLRNRGGKLPLDLEPDSKILLLTSPSHPKIPEILSVFEGELQSKGFDVVSDTFENYKNHKSTSDQFDLVILSSDAKPLYHDVKGVGPWIWGFMCDEKIQDKMIVVSFGSPYFLYDVVSAPVYVNAYSDCEASQKTVVKLLFGERSFQGRSPVSCPHAFERGDGLPGAWA